MKKRIMAMAIVAALSFLVSIGAVSTSFSKQPQQTAPKAQQQPLSTQIEVKAKAEFWDLEIDHLVVQGKSYTKGQKGDIQVQVGETINCRCYYKIKTIPVGDISGIDAKYWGSSKFTYVVAHYVHTFGQTIDENKITLSRRLPRFTYEDVEKWKKSMKSMGSKTWTRYMTSHWTATMDHVGELNVVNCYLEPNGFKETSESNNSIFTVGPGVYVHVTP